MFNCLNSAHVSAYVLADMCTAMYVVTKNITCMYTRSGDGIFQYKSLREDFLNENKHPKFFKSKENNKTLWVVEIQECNLPHTA